MFLSSIAATCSMHKMMLHEMAFSTGCMFTDMTCRRNSHVTDTLTSRDHVRTLTSRDHVRTLTSRYAGTAQVRRYLHLLGTARVPRRHCLLYTRCFQLGATCPLRGYMWPWGHRSCVRSTSASWILLRETCSRPWRFPARESRVRHHHHRHHHHHY